MPDRTVNQDTAQAADTSAFVRRAVHEGALLVIVVKGRDATTWSKHGVVRTCLVDSHLRLGIDLGEACLLLTGKPVGGAQLNAAAEAQVQYIECHASLIVTGAILAIYDFPGK